MKRTLYRLTSGLVDYSIAYYVDGRNSYFRGRDGQWEPASRHETAQVLREKYCWTVERIVLPN